MRGALACIGACLLAMAPLAARAQSSPVVQTAFAFTGINQQITLPLNGQGACSVQVNALSGATLVPSVSTDNANFTTDNAIGDGAIIAAQTAPYTGNVGQIALGWFRLQQTTTGSASGVVICSTVVGSQPSGAGSAGPALFVACDQSVVVGISTATTTQLVAATTGKTVVPCLFAATVVGTAPTLVFESGTGSLCGTGTAALSGTFAPLSTSTFAIGGSLGLLFKVPQSAALCVVTGGTTPSVQGVLTYAIQ